MPVLVAVPEQTERSCEERNAFLQILERRYYVYSIQHRRSKKVETTGSYMGFKVFFCLSKYFQYKLKSRIMSHHKQIGISLRWPIHIINPVDKTKLFLDFIFRLKCLWSKRIIVSYLKGFENKAEWRFPFWSIFFRFRDIYVFMQIGKVMMS